jgi:hypothetical protein
MKIPFGVNFDHMEFFEFLWLYERLVKEKQKEQENINSSKTLKPGQHDLAEEMLRTEGME